MKIENLLFMIIDDDKDDCFFFREAIKDLENNSLCMEANSTEKALDTLRSTIELPDFIFLDVNMPRLNGYCCLIELKKDNRLKHIPVIMYSTSFSEESVEEFQKLGASYCLIKPMDISTLPDQIMAAVEMATQHIYRE